MGRLSQNDPITASRISERKRIIAFRNALILGYELVDDEPAWEDEMFPFDTSVTATIRIRHV